jgi:hypothetical protein
MEELIQLMIDCVVGGNTLLMTYSPQIQTLIKSQTAIAYYDGFFHTPQK